MKIQEVTIEGYQSHTNSTFRLSPGLTVITGPSDAGKTAIIRALRWFAFNEPTGEAFLHTIRNPDGSVKEAVDQVKVSVTFDNGITITKTRRKGKTTYTHSAFPTAWEKAEIPPEIKETLGLVKQQYGDFETCLNFAFQLDAPFMLSESASVGAKVLGKLAGTEIVDKSISEVNKKTHQTRNDISYADKQIGEIDVSLTEYFDLDRFDAELKIAEAAFTKLKEDQSRHVALTALMNSYQLNTEQRTKYYDEVERLAGVVVASVSLGIAEREQAKKEKLEDLNVGFWKAVQDQNEPLRVNRELIQMTETGDDNIKGILREISGIPSCGKYDTSIVETINVDELLVIPMAEEDGVKEDDTGSYVLRKIYAIGGMKIETNKYYEISGYMYPHPKNQESTILVTNATPLQDVVESFSLTEEVREELDSLRPESMTVENIVSKLGTILNDLTYNVTHIVERDEVLLGLLLVYHSILRFRVPWDTDPIRGWVELKIVGDTGTGKSALVEKMMKYIGLGNRVNAESTSRTGLTYKMEQGNRGSWYIVWGAWPLADKELIWVDEDTGIEKDEYGEMTLARSDGKLEVKRAVTAETPCRVRAILSGNAPKGKRLSDYAQGAESLKDVFNNEDIRRFDFAIFMRSTDVDPEKYNRSLPSFPRTMSDDALKNNVLFAWSRTPEQVVFLPDTIDAILETATKLSKVYGNATDIPLVSPSDQRNKVARLAVALASLTHSVDESGERITVYPAHVNFIYDYLVQLYNAPGCGLNY